jgi:pilus assembly protein CpaB
MKPARIIILVVAVAAGGLAAFLASGPSQAPTAPPPVAVQIETVEILVAKADIGMGQVVAPSDIQWQIWPAAAASPNFVRKTDRPEAIQQLTGAIARTPFVIGEPIREAKLIKANGSGFLAAMLPSGMRAVSTEISPETGAGGFILPNDRVDVIRGGRDREAQKRTGIESYTSDTILTNVRVLAIDQAIEEKNGQKVVVGKVATLELTPRQVEVLALSRQIGTLSLSLRSLVDSNGSSPDAGPPIAPVDGPPVAPVAPVVSGTPVVVVYRGTTREAWSCDPECQR